RSWPACVVGMGGYVAGPAGVAAWLLRRPLLIHEQNAVAGTTNRMLAPLANKVVAGFDGAFTADKDVVVLGNPVRAELVAAAQAGVYSFDGERALHILVLGGSLGSQPINQVMPGVARRLLRSGRLPGTEIWHQAGERTPRCAVGAVRRPVGELYAYSRF
ncbi:MAG: glycosyltransferase, partial [Pseudohongiellaceae bacterium]